MSIKVFQFLDVNGDGSGNNNANGDYSSTPEEFYFEAPSRVNLYRMIISLRDTTGMIAEEYGNLGSALTNGYELKFLNADLTTRVNLTGGIPIQDNAGFGRYCYDAQIISWGPGDEYLNVRWTFSKSGGPLKLSAGQRLSITLSDDFTGLLEHRFMVQGELN